MITIEQTVYVSTESYHEMKPNLDEYIVTKVNGSSFYAHKKDSDHIIRFDKKKMICRTGIGYTKKAYLTAEAYWDEVNRVSEITLLRADIVTLLARSDLDMLRKIKDML